MTVVVVCPICAPYKRGDHEFISYRVCLKHQRQLDNARPVGSEVDMEPTSQPLKKESGMRAGKTFFGLLALAAATGVDTFDHVLPPARPRRGATQLGRRHQAHRVHGSKRRGRRVSNLFFARVLKDLP